MLYLWNSKVSLRNAVTIQLKCFTIDRGIPWSQHIYVSHFVYNYIFFIIYLSDKEDNDCNGVERYVKQKLKGNSIDFFPIKAAMDLPDYVEEEEEEDSDWFCDITIKNFNFKKICGFDENTYGLLATE